jgi:hypothetical protein
MAEPKKQRGLLAGAGRRRGRSGWLAAPLSSSTDIAELVGLIAEVVIEERIVEAAHDDAGLDLVVALGRGVEVELVAEEVVDAA